MKILYPVEPQILSQRVKLQDTINGIVIPGRDEKVSSVGKVIKTSVVAKNRGIEEGDYVVTRSPSYPTFPVCLTDNDEVPYDADIQLEVIDPSQIIAIYRENKEDVGQSNYTETLKKEE